MAQTVQQPDIYNMYNTAWQLTAFMSEQVMDSSRVHAVQDVREAGKIHEHGYISATAAYMHI